MAINPFTGPGHYQSADWRPGFNDSQLTLRGNGRIDPDWDTGAMVMDTDPISTVQLPRSTQYQNHEYVEVVQAETNQFINRKLKENDEFWVREILKPRILQNSAKIRWSRITFDQHMLDPRPNESVNRITSFSSRSNEVTFRAMGRAIRMAFEVFQTPHGRKIWTQQVHQLVNAVSETANFSAAKALVLAGYESEIDSTHMDAMARNKRQMQLELQYFGVLAFHRGLERCLTLGREDLVGKGKGPNMAILPFGETQYSAIPPVPSVESQNVVPVGSLPLREFRQFVRGKNDTIDPSVHENEVGQFFFMNSDLNFRDDVKGSSPMTVRVWNENLGNRNDITLDTAAKNCVLWQQGGDADGRLGEYWGDAKFGTKWKDWLGAGTWAKWKKSLKDEEKKAILELDAAERTERKTGRVPEARDAPRQDQNAEKRDELKKCMQHLENYLTRNGGPIKPGEQTALDGAQVIASQTACQATMASMMTTPMRKALARDNTGVVSIAWAIAISKSSEIPVLFEKDGFNPNTDVKVRNASIQLMQWGGYETFNEDSELEAWNKKLDEIPAVTIDNAPEAALPPANAGQTAVKRAAVVVVHELIRRAYDQLPQPQERKGDGENRDRPRRGAPEGEYTSVDDLTVYSNLPLLCARAGVKCPVSFIVCAPHIRYAMAATLVLDTTGVGNTFYSRSNFLVQLTADTRMVMGSYTVDMATAVTDPDQVSIIPDSKFVDYRGGFDTSTFYGYIDNAPYKRKMANGKSCFVIPVKPDFRPGKYVSLGGDAPWINTNSYSSAPRGIPNIEAFAAFWGWQRPNDGRVSRNRRHQDKRLMSNVICFQGQQTSPHASSLDRGAATITEQGHFRNMFFTGSQLVREGADHKYTRESNLADDRVRM